VVRPFEVGSVNLHRSDYGVGLLVSAILVFGGLLSWQTYQQQRALGRMMASMMGTSTGAIHGTNPVWYVLGTVLVAAAVGGIYLAIREKVVSGLPGQPGRPEESGAATAGAQSHQDATDMGGEIHNPEGQPAKRVLDLLPEDERRILEPVLTSPGITQIELRDRSDFSKSKVSQTVSGLEKRGLLYRERQGRTYRIYPSDDLRQSQG
jgi:uncharacterized membrane protein